MMKNVTDAGARGVPALLARVARGAGLKRIGLGLASHWPLPVLVAIEGGRRMYVDLKSGIGRGLFVTGRFDMEAIRPGLEALRPGGVFVDVGANVGFYSMLALDKVGSGGHVYGFEIDPRPLRCLRKTIASFGLSNVTIIEAAASNTDGTISFAPLAEHGHNSIDVSGTLNSGRVVKSVRLDTWARDIGLTRLDVLKIDVEGAEKLVIEGGRETIERLRPLILAECDEKTAASFGYSPADLVALFAEVGYSATFLPDVYTPVLLAKPMGRPMP